MGRERVIVIVIGVIVIGQVDIIVDIIVEVIAVNMTVNNSVSMIVAVAVDMIVVVDMTTIK